MCTSPLVDLIVCAEPPWLHGTPPGAPEWRSVRPATAVCPTTQQVCPHGITVPSSLPQYVTQRQLKQLGDQVLWCITQTCAPPPTHLCPPPPYSHVLGEQVLWCITQTK